MDKKLTAFRGATTLLENTQKEITEKTKELFVAMSQGLIEEDIVHVIISCTNDITALNPATVIRTELGLGDTALLSVLEPNIENGLKLCIRILLTAYTKKKSKELRRFFYLHGAKHLRKKIINIAIDGPSGSGKSTVSRLLAQKLGIKYIDTGAMFRSIAYVYDISEDKDLCKILDNLEMTLLQKEDRVGVIINGVDVSGFIRQHKYSELASKISKEKEVREKLTEIERKEAKKESCILDGRDIGSYVLQDADYKIFLTATLEERAKRRYKELLKDGQDVSFEQVLQDIKERDYNDSNRKISPLKKATDAIEVDTTNKSIEQVVQELTKIVEWH